MKDPEQARRTRGLKRIFNKILGCFAERSFFLPGSLRVKLHKLRGVNFKKSSSCFIGRNVYLDDMRPDLITIGEGVFITNGAKILTHFLDGRNRSPDKGEYFDFYFGKVTIEDNVFIGSGAIITKPVSIGSGAIIGANAVISKDVPENAIMIGNPATNVSKK